jgi:hypothetical protein
MTEMRYGFGEVRIGEEEELEEREVSDSEHRKDGDPVLMHCVRGSHALAPCGVLAVREEAGRLP